MNAAIQRHLHLLLTGLWAAMIPIALVTGWIRSLVFISAISIYANVAGHWSSYQASRAEEKVDED